MAAEGRAVRRAGLALALAGLNPLATAKSVAALPAYVRAYRRFKRMSIEYDAMPPTRIKLLPALTDAADDAGSAGSEYFLGDLWVARHIFRAAPARHVDVGSRIDGLIAHLLTFRDVDVVDIRPLESPIEGLNFIHADARSLEAIAPASVPSASSVHALEHFGLGRYGDPIDPFGHVKALHALGRIVEPRGDLYVGVPVGRPAVEFNAHRILDPRFVPTELPDYELVAFAAVREGELDESVAPEDLVDVPYACGLYHLRRLAAQGG